MVWKLVLQWKMANSKAGAEKAQMSVEHLLTRRTKEMLCNGTEHSNKAQKPVCTGLSMAEYIAIWAAKYVRQQSGS